MHETELLLHAAVRNYPGLRGRRTVVDTEPAVELSGGDVTLTIHYNERESLWFVASSKNGKAALEFRSGAHRDDIESIVDQLRDPFRILGVDIDDAFTLVEERARACRSALSASNIAQLGERVSSQMPGLAIALDTKTLDALRIATINGALVITNPGADCYVALFERRGSDIQYEIDGVENNDADEVARWVIENAIPLEPHLRIHGGVKTADYLVNIALDRKSGDDLARAVGRHFPTANDVSFNDYDGAVEIDTPEFFAQLEVNHGDGWTLIMRPQDASGVLDVMIKITGTFSPEASHEVVAHWTAHVAKDPYANGGDIYDRISTPLFGRSPEQWNARYDNALQQLRGQAQTSPDVWADRSTGL